MILSAPIDVIGNLPAATFIADSYGTIAYKDWGNEPFVAVNPLNPSQIVTSSFSYPTTSTSAGANIFYSTNGGAAWTSQFTVPAPAAGIFIPRDWTFAYDSGGVLHGAVLGSPTSNFSQTNIYHGVTTDPTSLGAWTWSGGGTQINSQASTNRTDQPWIAVGSGTVFVGYDDFHSGTGERVAVSNNNGATFVTDNAINNGPQANFVNPGTRIAVDANGTVYSIFGVGGPSIYEGVHNVTYYLNRSINGGVTWDFNASSAIGGLTIASGISSQLDNPGTQASNNWFAHVNDLRGNITAIALDKSGSHIYVLFGRQDAFGTDRIYLAEFHPVGSQLVASAAIVVSPPGERAALPSLTILDSGTVVIMYETYGGDGNIHIHVASSTDFGLSIASDVELYSFAPLTLLAATGSSTANREFGDYDFITSIGDSFYETFAGLGNVHGGGIDTTALIDPFFFSGVFLSEPGTLSLLLLVLSCLLPKQRRPRTEPYSSVGWA